MSTTKQQVEPFGWERDVTEPRIASVSVEGGRVTIQLIGSPLEGTSISFEARRLDFLANATDEQLSRVEVTAHGDGIAFPAVNVHIAALGLVETLTGLRSLRGQQKKAGASTSEAKRTAAQKNGAKGGRPPKNPKA